MIDTLKGTVLVVSGRLWWIGALMVGAIVASIGDNL